HVWHQNPAARCITYEAAISLPPLTSETFATFTARAFRLFVMETDETLRRNFFEAIDEKLTGYGLHGRELAQHRQILTGTNMGTFYDCLLGAIWSGKADDYIADLLDLGLYIAALERKPTSAEFLDAALDCMDAGIHDGYDDHFLSPMKKTEALISAHPQLGSAQFVKIFLRLLRIPNQTLDAPQQKRTGNKRPPQKHELDRRARIANENGTIEKVRGKAERNLRNLMIEITRSGRRAQLDVCFDEENATTLRYLAFKLPSDNPIGPIARKLFDRLRRLRSEHGEVRLLTCRGTSPHQSGTANRRVAPYPR
ncbi:MAG TPA: hypothetical protein VMV79_05445, partial [Alphaproteobacteria bacterium]|nr:hypothetical protein [Alphaproteobacteria bacterium]